MEINDFKDSLNKKRQKWKLILVFFFKVAKKISRLIKHNKNSLGHKKFKPLTSVINLVLNRRAIASTNKNELVDRSAWLINIQKPDNIRDDCPLTIQRVNQCISTTVEYATNFFKSIW